MAALACALVCVVPAAAAAAGGIPPARGIPAPPTSESIRAQAQQAATDEARSQVSHAKSTAWQRAIDQAKEPDVRDIVQPRPVALIVGLAWLFLATRAMVRGRRRRRSVVA